MVYIAAHSKQITVGSSQGIQITNTLWARRDLDASYIELAVASPLKQGHRTRQPRMLAKDCGIGSHPSKRDASL